MNMSFTCRNAYLIKFRFTKPRPKEKYAICVCEEKPLFFFISSNPRTRFLPDSQLKVSPTDLSFLRKDSYVNTAEAVTCVIPHTCKIIKDFGTVPENIRQQIKALVRESETLPKRFIDIIIKKL
ncbi:Uncharacterized protein dnl_56300 [Desulfonema limicola]|uniref:Uncharacterized protein n=1 Tax=Desulfonema limicola TaxID=45656 RepID=A0A975GJA5_9BACT|nr:Uncharacterized protein dnl_56300 [Desulfonema limicola]